MSSFAKSQGGRDFTLSVQALPQLAQPDDVTGAVTFLGSNARLITGDTLRVDGGSKLQRHRGTSGHHRLTTLSALKLRRVGRF